MTLSARSWERLEGVHADLVKVVELAALGPVGFVVTEGLRTRERQATLVMAGKSRTMNSRHLTGHAVDLAVVLPGNVISWDKEDYKRLSVEVKLAAVQLADPDPVGRRGVRPELLRRSPLRAPSPVLQGGSEPDGRRTGDPDVGRRR